MNRDQAMAVASALGFTAQRVGWNLWTCSKTLPSGRVVTICDDCVLIFKDQDEASQGERHDNIIEFTE